MADLRDLEPESRVIVRGAPQPGFPLQPNTTSGPVLWLSPDEWLVLGGCEADYPSADAVVDVSANWSALELSALTAEDVLAGGCSLDLRQVLAPDRCAQTLLAGIPVILLRPDDENVRIFVRASLAGYLRLWLADQLGGRRDGS